MPPIPNDAPIEITIPDDAWRPTGEYQIDDETGDADPTARLCANIRINGTDMYLEAYAVIYRDPDGALVSSNEEERDFNAVLHLLDDDAEEQIAGIMGDSSWPPAITTLRDRQYVLVATPCSE